MTRTGTPTLDSYTGFLLTRAPSLSAQQSARQQSAVRQSAPHRPGPLLRRIGLSAGLLLVKWATRTRTLEVIDLSTDGRVAQPSQAGREAQIRHHHTQRIVEREQRQAEARALMRPLVW